MPKPSSSSALVVLSDPQIGSNFQFDRAKAATAIAREFALIKDAEGQTALRALRLGAVLCCVRECIGHGKFMPFVKQTFGGSHKTATDYMRLLRYYVEKGRVKSPDVLLLADTKTDLALSGSLFAKAVKFIGEKTLTELIAEAREASKTVPDEKDEGGDDTPPTIDPELVAEQKRAEFSNWLARGRQLCVQENIFQHLKPAEIRTSVSAIDSLHTDVQEAVKPLLKK